MFFSWKFGSFYFSHSLKKSSAWYVAIEEGDFFAANLSKILESVKLLFSQLY